MDRNTKNNIIVGVSLVGGLAILGIVIWKFSKPKNTTISLSSKNNEKPNIANVPLPNTNVTNNTNNALNEVQKLQKNLNTLLGFNRLVVDGVYGEQTKSELTTFAKTKDLQDKLNVWSMEQWVDITNYAIKNGVYNGYQDRNGVWVTIAREVKETDNQNNSFFWWSR